MAETESVARSQRALDWLNFFVADVETAFGPFVAVWLSSQGWSQGSIGLMLSVNSGLALATQIPAGWVVDHIERKRIVLWVSLACIAGGALLIALFPRTWWVAVGEGLHGVTGGTVQLAIAAIALGLVGHQSYSVRIGRNQRFNSLGNAATAGSMGAAGHFLSGQVPFLIGAGLCLPAAVALCFIRREHVDPHRARQGKKDTAPGRWRDLLKNRGLMTFALVLFLFQFANASLLPLAGEQLALSQGGQSDVTIALLVIVPQIVTALLATWVARKSDEWGRKVMLAAAPAALLVQTVLFGLAVSPWLLVAGSTFGGVTAALIGVLTPLVVADCMKGTGRYTVGLGAVGMISGVGATLSTMALGFVAERAGFAAGFAAIGASAVVAIGIVWLVLPETVEASKSD